MSAALRSPSRAGSPGGISCPACAGPLKVDSNWCPGCHFTGGDTVVMFHANPPLSVFDPKGFLDPARVKAVSDPLAAFYQKEGIDVVVVLADLGSAPPEHVARSFASAWCKSPLHCVVLHVPGREDGPRIVPDGRLVVHLNPDQVREAVNNGRRRAASDAKDSDKVGAAANEAADMLRYWMANAINRSEMISQRERPDPLRVGDPVAPMETGRHADGRGGRSGHRRNLAVHRFPPQTGTPLFPATRIQPPARRSPYRGNHAVVDLGSRHSNQS